MKTTILTSFVAIALLSARRSFAIVVRSQVNIPGAALSFAIHVRATYLLCLWICLAVPGPSLSQQNVPLSNQARRHLDLAATSGKEILISLSFFFLTFTAIVQRDDEERDVSTGLLYIIYNFLHIVSFLNLLVGRHLNAQFDDLVQEREFYKRGLSRFSKEDFKKAHYPAWVRGRFEQIYDNIFTIPVPDFRPFGI